MDFKKITEVLVTAKAVQYVMIAVLLIGAFFLPRLAVKQETEAARQEAMAEVQQLNNSQQSGGNAQVPKGTIVLDPGHGGDDPGMIGESGINEKKLNLIYAKKLQTLLEAKGYRVVLTRETEEGLYDADAAHKKAQDMQRRVAIIAEEAPLITVSIHQNSYQDPAVSGPQVFYYEHSAEGQKLAKSIQDRMNSELSEARSRVEKSNSSYYILKRSQGTTVIVECGFLSNPEEEARLQEEAYQDRVCAAVCAGILQYLDEHSEAGRIDPSQAQNPRKILESSFAL